LTQKDKLFDKIMEKPIRKDITYDEVRSLLNHKGFEEIEGSGSRVKFHNKTTNDMIILHKPHPGNELKTYQVRDIQNKLNENSDLD
jgi:predicted RNA binding protein YcfA (HicA-like mRNA interferase family)